MGAILRLHGEREKGKAILLASVWQSLEAGFQDKFAVQGKFLSFSYSSLCLSLSLQSRLPLFWTVRKYCRLHSCRLPLAISCTLMWHLNGMGSMCAQMVEQGAFHGALSKSSWISFLSSGTFGIYFSSTTISSIK